MISYLANPQRFLRFEKFASPLFGLIALICIGAGVWIGLFNSPADKVQGQSVRIMYVHVPAAWSCMMAYMALAAASLVSFVWRHSLADSAARAFALNGAAFTFLALVTGALWGKPTWGTYWQWDGRMTSVLVLFFIYIAYLSLWSLVEDEKRAARLAAILAMVGIINIPIIKFSVDWWNTLHQPASVSSPGAPGLPWENKLPTYVMMAGYTALFAWLSLGQIRNDIQARQARRQQSKTASTVKVETI